MAEVTALYDAIWDEYILWSVLVGVVTFGWL